jgi:hypothetical protein
VVATLVIALLTLLVVLAFALTLAVVFSKEANRRLRTNTKQGNQEPAPIHVSLSSN